MEEKKVNIREMTMEDFEEVHALWMGIHGFGIRSIDDSKEGVERFIRRNPTTSMVACENDRIIGAILCGHDGRRGCLYHVCVHEDYRKQGIGQKMVHPIPCQKWFLIAFKKNDIGNHFWQGMGWTFREDVNYYEYVTNEENQTVFNP